VVDETFGEYEAPDVSGDPPVETVYQFIVPAEAAALSVTVPASHLAAGVVPVMFGVVLTVAVTETLGEDVHPLAVAST
jgi:hypothetical protein